MFRLAQSAIGRRAIAVLVGIALWAVALCAALEAWARWDLRQQEALARETESLLYAPGAWSERESVIIRDVLGAPPDTDADFRAWRALMEIPPDNPAWQERADNRHEILAVLNGRGGVIRAVLPSVGGCSPLDALAAQITSGTLLEALPPDCAADFQGALAGAASGHQIREYPIPLDGASAPEVFQFVLMPLDRQQHKGLPPDAAFMGIIRQSIWKELWHSFRPDIRHQDIMDFATNSLGWRDGEITLPRPAGVFRIVCVGGSTTAEGAHNALTYPKLMERHLRDVFPGAEVVNAGIFALGSYGEAARAQDYLHLEPNLIVHYNFVNDVASVLDHAETAESPLSLRRALRWLASRSAFVRLYLDLWAMPSTGALRAGMEATFANMDTLRREAQGMGVTVAFCSFARPAWEKLPPQEKAFFNQRILNMIWGPRLTMRAYCRLVDLYNDTLRCRCAEWGAPFLDVAPELAGGIDRFTDICHMRLWSIEDKARVIARHLGPLIPKASGLEP